MQPLILGLLFARAAFCDLVERAPASNGSAFTSAANELISSYIPASAWSSITAAVQAAASSASVTGDPSSLAYSALEASPRPSWFQNAIPSAYSSNVVTLESAIDAIRPTAGASGSGSAVSTVITTTSTNSNGQPTTATLTTSVTPSGSSSNNSSSSSSGAAAVPTQFVGNAAGVVALVGLAMAL